MAAIEPERVLEIVEQARVATPIDPGVKTARERPWQEIRDREQPALAAVQDIQILDRLVHLTVLDVAEARAITAFEQDAHERVEEMQVLGCRIKRERIDRPLLLLVARRKRNLQLARSDYGVIEKQFVEIAEPEKEQSVRMLLLDRSILPHERRGGFGH